MRTPNSSARSRQWNEVYNTKGAHQLSWFQPEPTVSLELIDGLHLDRTQPVIDMGGGASPLVDRLPERGHTDVWVPSPPSFAPGVSVQEPSAACGQRVRTGFDHVYDEPDPRAFRPLLDTTRHPVWVAAFVLRTGSYQPIADELATWGLVTETSTGTFPQRRFTNPAEQRYALDAVTSTGHDPHEKETHGSFAVALLGRSGVGVGMGNPSADVSRI